MHLQGSEYECDATTVLLGFTVLTAFGFRCHKAEFVQVSSRLGVWTFHASCGEGLQVWEVVGGNSLPQVPASHRSFGTGCPTSRAPLASAAAVRHAPALAAGASLNVSRSPDPGIQGLNRHSKIRSGCGEEFGTYEKVATRLIGCAGNFFETRNCSLGEPGGDGDFPLNGRRNPCLDPKQTRTLGKTVAKDARRIRNPASVARVRNRGLVEDAAEHDEDPQASVLVPGGDQQLRPLSSL